MRKDRSGWQGFPAIFPLLLCLLLSLAATCARADSEIHILFDLDDDAATGCVVDTADGPFAGVETVTVTTFSVSAPPQVVGVVRRVCVGGALIDDASFTPLPPTTWPVGMDVGPGGLDVVETYGQPGPLAPGQRIRMGFLTMPVGGAPAGGDALTQTSGGQPILHDVPPAIPVPLFGAPGALLLSLLLTGVLLAALRRRPGTLGVAVLFVVAGASWVYAASQITRDGLIGDWVGVAPLATDNAGDGPPNTDLRAIYLKTGIGQFDFRFDLDIQPDDAPAVIASTPVANATDVAGDATITLTFNEPVDVVGEWFRVDCPTSGVRQVADTVVSGGPTIFTITPDTGFAGGETCSLTVFASQVTDQDSIDPPDHMAADHVLAFTIDAPPAVIASTPADAAVDVAGNAVLTLTFSEPVAVTGEWFRVDCSTSGVRQVADTVVSGGPVTFTIDPVVDFVGDETCSVTVFAAQVTDQDANDPPDHMAADHVFGFATDQAPTVIASSPADAATDVAGDAGLSITFSEPVAVTGEWFRIDCPTSGIRQVADTAVSGGPTTFAITPATGFAAGETCTVTVFAAQVGDLDGNDPPDHMAANHVFGFTIDQAPSVVAHSPANGGSLLPGASVTVEFSEPVNVTANAFTLTCAGAPQAFTLSPAAPGGAATYTLAPLAALPVGATCVVNVIASQVGDVDANDPPEHPLADQGFSFFTDAPPAVQATTPAAGATGVAANANVDITFSEPVNLAAGWFQLDCPVSGMRTAANTAVSGMLTSFSLDPVLDFEPGETCVATVFAAAVTDIDANDPPDQMAANHVFAFTIDEAPAVASTNPTEGAVVAGNASLTVTFSEPVTVSGDWFTLTCADSGTLLPAATTVTGGPTTFTIDPDVDFTPGEACALTIVAAQVRDLDSADPPEHPASDHVVQFSADAAPDLASSTPTDGAVQVGTQAVLSLTFSEPVDVDGIWFDLSCSITGARAWGDMVVAGGPTTFTIDPTADFAIGETCVLTIDAARVTDQDSIDPVDAMVANRTVGFTIDQPPTISATLPADGAPGAPPDADVLISFSEAVNVTGEWFHIDCPGSGARLVGDTVVSGGPVDFQIDPNVDFQPGETCVVTVHGAQITDADDGDPPDAMLANHVFSFTIDAPPAVQSTTPAHQGVVATNASLAITFSEAVNVTGNWFTIQCSATGTRQPAATVVGGGPTTFTIDPNVDFATGETCDVTIHAAQVTDQDSNDPPDQMAADHGFQFSVDATPWLTGSSPADGAGPLATDIVITLNFSEAVLASANAFSLECPAASPVAFTTSPSLPGSATSFTLTPSSLLPAGATCRVTARAAEITDVDGIDPPDQMAADQVIEFTTDAYPAVTGTTPANGAVQVGSQSNVVIQFSEPVDVTGGWFEIACAVSGNHTPTNSVVSGGPNSYTIDPNGDFVAGEACAVTVYGAQVTDQDAVDPPDAMAANHVFGFTVDTPPAVTSTTPADGATGVAVASTITVNFNESVTATSASFELACAGVVRGFSLSGAATAYTLTPDSDLPAGATCQVTVIANQISDSDAGDPPDHMTADHVFDFSVPPQAVNDTYPQTVIGNVGIDSAQIPYSVVDNDQFAAGTATISAYDATSANGGDVVMVTSGAGVGRFSYNPPAGFEGNDSFTYTLQTTGGTSTATVTIPVGATIWFVDNNVNACLAACDGRLSNPFTTLASLAAINDGTGNHPGDGDTIFLYESGSAYDASLTLRASQKLVGQDASASLASIAGVSPGSGSLPLPAMNAGNGTLTRLTSAGTTVTLATGNTVRGLTLGNASTAALAGNNFGTLTVADVAIDNPAGAALNLTTGAFASGATFTGVSSGGGASNVSLASVTGDVALGGGALSGASSHAFNLSGGGGNLTYAGGIAGTAAARVVSIANRSSGTVTLTGAVTGSGSSQGVFLSANTGATIRFAGGLQLSTGANAAFTASGGGTVEVCDEFPCDPNATGNLVNTLTTTTGTALNVANTTIGANRLEFRSISAGTGASGPVNGIVLNSTGSVGRLRVTGTGLADSGGIIQRTSGHGISLTNTLSPTFDRMRIQNTTRSGIAGTLVNGFSFTNGVINASGSQADDSNIAFNDQASGTESNLTGTVTITGNTLTNALWHGVDILNFNGTLASLDISNNTLTSSTSTATSKGVGIRVNTLGSASTVAHLTRADIQNNVIANFPSGEGIQVQGGNANAAGPSGTIGTPGSGSNRIAITGNRIAGDAATKLATQAISATVTGKGQGNFDISTNGSVANPLTNMLGHGILLGVNDNVTVEMAVSGNTLVANNTFGSPGIGGGTGGLVNTDTPYLTATASNNAISATDGNGILLVARGASGMLRAKLQNNAVAAPLGGVRPGIRLDSGNASSLNETVCANLSGNTSAGSGGHPGIGLRKQGTASAVHAFGVHGMAATASPGVENYIDALNPAGNGTQLISATSGFSNCSLP